MDSASKGKGERKDRHRTRPGYWGAGHNIQVHLIRQKGKFWQTPDFLTENHKILKMWSTTDWLLLSICLNFSGFTHVFSMPSFLPQFASLTLKLIKLLDCYKKKTKNYSASWQRRKYQCFLVFFNAIFCIPSPPVGYSTFLQDAFDFL